MKLLCQTVGGSCCSGCSTGSSPVPSAWELNTNKDWPPVDKYKYCLQSCFSVGLLMVLAPCLYPSSEPALICPSNHLSVRIPAPRQEACQRSEPRRQPHLHSSLQANQMKEKTHSLNKSHKQFGNQSASPEMKAHTSFKETHLVTASACCRAI